MAASPPTKCKCPKCGYTMIVDASSDHTPCVWCGTSIPNVLAKESEIPPVVAGVQEERPNIDKEKLDKSNTSGLTLSEAAAEKTAGPIGTTYSVNHVWKLILAVIIAPVLALAIYTLIISLVTIFIREGRGSWVVNTLAGLCAIGLGAYPIFASVAPFVREQSLARKVFLGVIRTPAIAGVLLLFYFAFTAALGSLNNDIMLTVRLAAFLPGLIIIISLIERMPNKVMATSTESLDGSAGTIFSVGSKTCAFLIGLAAFWFPLFGGIGGCYRTNLGTYASVAQGIVLVLLGIAGGVRRKRSSLAGGGGFFVGWLSEVILGSYWTETFSCGHNLLPFEAAIFLVVAFIPSLLGLSIGKLLRCFSTRWHSFANVLIMISAATTLLSSMLLPLEKWVNDHRALSMITRLTKAQVDFKAHHNDIGYACHLSDLSDSFSETLTSPSSEKGIFYEKAKSGGYYYQLWCYKDTPQRNNFAIMAQPWESVTGNVAYCVRRDGKIRSLPLPDRAHWSRNWSRSCWIEGTVVTTIAQ